MRLTWLMKMLCQSFSDKWGRGCWIQKSPGLSYQAIRSYHFDLACHEKGLKILFHLWKMWHHDRRYSSFLVAGNFLSVWARCLLSTSTWIRNDVLCYISCLLGQKDIVWENVLDLSNSCTKHLSLQWLSFTDVEVFEFSQQYRWCLAIPHTMHVSSGSTVWDDLDTVFLNDVIGKCFHSDSSLVFSVACAHKSKNSSSAVYSGVSLEPWLCFCHWNMVVVV